MERRECGMLLPVASLPSKYGIGAFSREAYTFVDWLAQAGQQYWQILPLGPTGYGDSPYQSFGAFAGNPYFIDPEQLVEEGLLMEKECRAVDFGDNPSDVDYEKIYRGRFPLLRKAYERWKKAKAATGQDVKLAGKLLGRVLPEETKEYCFYMAVKDSFGGKSWTEWDLDIRIRDEKAVKRYRKELKDDILFYEFLQLQFRKQWQKLKAYANRRGVRIIGDIPIYVALDSADSWAHPELFQFDEEGRPEAVAGCPPDAFAVTGQLWGNPLYRWDYHRKTGYAWWMERMEYSFGLYDVVRVDHFRGFDAYYSIPAADETAEFGHWEKGPGYELFQAFQERFGEMNLIAEDLGFLTPSVHELLRRTGFPGMKVLEFAFDETGESDYLPHRYPSANCVVYTGTHDNMTLQGWYEELDEKARAFAVDYLGNENTPPEQIHWDYIRLALASMARLAVIPVQDYLGLGNEARINEPSTLGKNWRWRMDEDDLTEELAEKCRHLAELYGRCERPKKETEPDDEDEPDLVLREKKPRRKTGRAGRWSRG
ncbi:MAG: 4-alpha-glucanotransferase [Clostridiales bacterium]|nr:4-alpha-glucanotransferase [Clostridiales bacterium]